MFLSSREFGTTLSAWLEKGDKAPSVVEGFHGSQKSVVKKETVRLHSTTGLRSTSPQAPQNPTAERKE